MASTACWHYSLHSLQREPTLGRRATTERSFCSNFDTCAPEQASPQAKVQRDSKAGAAEVLFVDPGIADLPTLLRGVRPGIEAVVLDTARPPARQVAAALVGRRGLVAVHIVAHGAPGRVIFASGEWSAATLIVQASEFAAIGQSLAADGSLRLWSCFTGAGTAGEALVARLTATTGAEVMAASGLVGAAALGGRWALDAREEISSPLTAAGMVTYAGVLITRGWSSPGTSSNWNDPNNWTPTGVPLAGDDVVIGGTVGSDYTVTLDIDTTALDSLTLDFSNGTNVATLAIGTCTINVNGTGGTDAVTVSGNNAITIAGGVLGSGTLSLSANTAKLTGFGTLNIAGNITGAGTLQASGGTLTTFGTIASGVVLSIDTTVPSDLRIAGTATSAVAIAITSSDQTLEIGSGGSLTINASENITNGMIALDGGTLTAAAGIAVGTGATLAGSGTVAAPLSGSGTITTSAGTLDVIGNIGSGVTGLQIANASGATLRIDGAVASGDVISFRGSAGTLNLTDTSGGVLQGFNGTITGLTVGNSGTVPTNQIDLAGLANTSFRSASLNVSTDVLTLDTTGGAFTLQLSGTYAAGTQVISTGDGSGGSDIFLSSDPTYTFTLHDVNSGNSAAVDTWADASSWSGASPVPPPVSPTATTNITFTESFGYYDVIYMPPTLNPSYSPNQQPPGRYI